MVTINDATKRATIYYTTDGTAPSTNSSVFAAPISVGTIETLKRLCSGARRAPAHRLDELHHQ